jgi:hypothetical protein
LNQTIQPHLHRRTADTTKAAASNLFDSDLGMLTRFGLHQLAIHTDTPKFVNQHSPALSYRGLRQKMQNGCGLSGSEESSDQVCGYIMVHKGEEGKQIITAYQGDKRCLYWYRYCEILTDGVGGNMLISTF